MTKTIYLKNYDVASFGIQLDLEANNENGYVKITEVSINDTMGVKDTKERTALTNALEQLIENHKNELLALYEEKYNEIEDY